MNIQHRIKELALPRTIVDRPGSSEDKFPPSMTIQGEALSIDEVIEKYSSGLDLPRRPSAYIDAEFDAPEGFYSPDVDLTDLDRMKKRVASYEGIIAEEQKKAAEPTHPKTE